MRAKNKSGIIVILGILLVTILGVYFGIFRSTSLVGIGTTYVLETEELEIKFQTSSKHSIITGCEPTGCAGKSFCSVRGEVVDEILGCPIEQCYGAGWQGCDSTGYSSNCEYGANCGEGVWGTRCSQHCYWGEADVGRNGGVIYDDLNNCAWVVEINDKQGNLIKKWDAKTKYGEEWSKSLFIREEINFNYAGTRLKFVESLYSGQLDSCVAIKFRAEDDKFIYDVCLGDDGDFDPVCEQALTKTCKLSCPSDKVLDPETCECKIPEPDCVVDSDCSEGLVCENNECILENVPPPDEEPTPEPTPTPPPDDDSIQINYDKLLVMLPLGLFIAILIIIIVRNKNVKKKK